MKWLITSDVHGDYHTLLEIVNQHKDAEIHINAGDNSLPKHLIEKFHMISVKGNNDFGVDLPYIRILEFDQKKILLTHGHHENVKFGMDRLKLKAKLHQVDMVIFGHTHQKYYEIDEGIMFINPGALGGGQKTYAIYQNQQITFYKG